MLKRNDALNRFGLQMNSAKNARCRALLGALLVLLSHASMAESTNSKNKVETLSEVTIIGNTELPNVNFDLTWQLPTIEKRDDQSPPKQVPGVLVPLEPERHRQQIHFSRFLEVDSPKFKAR